MTDIPRVWHSLAFCAAMISAIRDGRKTMTRRIQHDGIPPWMAHDGLWLREPIEESGNGNILWTASKSWAEVHRGPYGPDGKPLPWRWKPSALAARYMPKCLCRTLAVCEAVRPERVQDITDDDAIAEGTPPGDQAEIGCRCSDADCQPGVRFCGRCGLRIVDWVMAYQQLWDSLHPKPGDRFADNPWVWVASWPQPLLTTDYAEAQRILAGATP